MKLCSYSDITNFNDSISGDFSDVINPMIEMVTQQIFKFCNRDFSKVTDFSESYHSNSFYYFYPKYAPITEIKSIKLNDHLLSSDDYDFDNYCVFLNDRYVVNRRIKMELIYTAGYEMDTTDTSLIICTDDLKMACVLQVSHLFNRRQNIGSTSISVGNTGSIGYQKEYGLLDEVKSLLKPYRRYAI